MSFPSGVVVIDIRTDRAVLTVECSLSKGIGISQLRGKDDAFSGHDLVVTETLDAIAVLDRWLRHPPIETV